MTTCRCQPKAEIMDTTNQLEWMHSIVKGAIAYQEQDYKLAEQMLTETLNRLDSPTDSVQERALPLVLENLSLIFAEQGRFTRAERVLRRAMLLASTQQAACRVTYKLAQVALFQGRYDDADRLTIKAIGLGQSCSTRDIEMESEQLLRLALLWLNWGKDQIALDNYRKMLEVRRTCLFPFRSNVPVDPTQLSVLTNFKFLRPHELNPETNQNNVGQSAIPNRNTNGKMTNRKDSRSSSTARRTLKRSKR